jgi:uncharacterized DUF497 family protein
MPEDRNYTAIQESIKFVNHTMRLGQAVLLLIMLSFEGNAAPFILLDSFELSKVKQMVHDGTASSRTMISYSDLLGQADESLTLRNPTVVDKTIAPPSGNKHDYLSIGRYWWPDPEVSDGLPWIRKDGVTNPDTQTAAVDRKLLGAMIEGIRCLSLAFYFSEEEKYAFKAISIVSVRKVTHKNERLR